MRCIRDQLLFDRYDTDGSGTIDKRELRAMLKELDREQLQVSEAMIERWIEDEFASVDGDGSAGASRLARWASNA